MTPSGTEWHRAAALAASWAPELAERYGQALGREQAGKGHQVALAPTVNIVRVPHWGRAFETFSEDPYLAGRLAVAEIDGIESTGVLATVKHYAANNQSASSLRGVLLILAALVSYGIALNVARPLQQRHGALPVVWRGLGFALLLTAPLGLPDVVNAHWRPAPLFALLRSERWGRASRR